MGSTVNQYRSIVQRASLLMLALLALTAGSPALSQEKAAHPLKIVVYGGNGSIGSRIVREALARGHSVTVVDRTVRPVEGAESAKLTLVVGDVFSGADVSKNLEGKDVLVSAVSARSSVVPDPYGRLARTVVESIRLRSADNRPRFVMVGGAASLRNAEGKRIFDTLEPIPQEFRGELLSLVQALDYLRTVTDVPWTFLSPAMEIMPGVRTGKFRLGTEQIVTDSRGRSAISMEDYAVAMLDEIEKPQFVRSRFTVGY